LALKETADELVSRGIGFECESASIQGKAQIDGLRSASRRVLKAVTCSEDRGTSCGVSLLEEKVQRCCDLGKNPEKEAVDIKKT
jgi:hypothetical protein